MYYVTHPDGTQTKHTSWEEVAPLFHRYNVENADALAKTLSPEGIAEQNAGAGGSPWQDNELDTRDAKGNYTGRYLVIEGQEGGE